MSTYTNKAIKTAVENGYDFKQVQSWYRPVAAFEARGEVIDFPVETFLLDTLFWQALGRGLGWSKRTYTEKYVKEDYVDSQYGQQYQEMSEETWKYQQHRLIDHIQEGQDIESYFKELLNN
jgi:hypothetical protein